MAQGWEYVKDVYEDFVLNMEGGYVNHPADPGGPTNRGVTLGTFQTLAPKLLGISGTLANLKALTAAQHEKFLKYFWDDINGDWYKNPVIAAYVTELAWGSGEAGAEKRIIQKAVQKFGKTLKVDGQISRADVDVINSIDSEAFFDALTDARYSYYQSLSTWPVFGKGWTRRINLFVELFKKKVPTITI